MLLSALPFLVTAAPAAPRFSWDTVPVFYHSCNFSGPYNAQALDIMAKFPMVTVEKGQGVFDPTDKRFAEDKIVEALRGVKARNANVSTLLYYNSVLDWPFYRLHEELMRRPELWARGADGSVCRTNGDGSFPNHTNMLSFDFAQAAARDLWASACLNATRTGYVDGCFSDRADGKPHCEVRLRGSNHGGAARPKPVSNQRRPARPKPARRRPRILEPPRPAPSMVMCPAATRLPNMAIAPS